MTSEGQSPENPPSQSSNKDCKDTSRDNLRSLKRKEDQERKISHACTSKSRLYATSGKTGFKGSLRFAMSITIMYLKLGSAKRSRCLLIVRVL